MTAVLVAVASSLIHTPTGDNPMTRLMETRADVLVMGVLGITLGRSARNWSFADFCSRCWSAAWARRPALCWLPYRSGCSISRSTATRGVTR